MMLKITKVAIPILACAMLSGCMNATAGESIKISESDKNNPVMIQTYDYNGQKIDQVAVNKVDISSNKEIDSALNLRYGQNTIIHDNNPLIAYSGLTNFADQYDKNLAQNTKGFDLAGDKVVPDDKSQPIAGEIYTMFKSKLPDDGTVVLIKSKSGAPIGIFAGHVVNIKDFGSSEDSNALVTIDKHKILMYSCAYTMYPVSAMKSMAEKTRATNTSHQQNVKTRQALPTGSNNNSNNKKK